MTDQTQAAVSGANSAVQKRIWFDRKERPVHIYEHTPKSTATRGQLAEYLAGWGKG